MYVQEFYWQETGYRSLELFFLAEPAGTIQNKRFHLDRDKQSSGGVEENRWFSKPELKRVKVYPQFLREQFWQDSQTSVRGRRIYWKGAKE